VRVLVCGGRDYADQDKVFEVLDYINQNRSKITLLIHGAATGADALGREWAKARGIEDDPYPALWTWLEAPNAVIKRRRDGTAYNANAGPDRNAKMLLVGKPDAVVAFPGGRGTNDMMERARINGVRVWEVRTRQ
jgi:hypothetical protein